MKQIEHPESKVASTGCPSITTFICLDEVRLTLVMLAVLGSLLGVGAGTSTTSLL